MADVTGRIGDQDVALDNAATEATLKELLNAIKGQTSSLKNLTSTAGAAGVSPAAIANANKGVTQLGQSSTTASVASKVASTAFSGLSKGAMLLGGVLGDIVAGGIQTGKNLMDLAGKMLDGQGRVSDVFGAFKDLPFGIGMVAGLFEKLMKMQEAELDAYRQITKSGVNLGGSLADIRLNALEMGTTLEGFGKLVGENSKLFAQMGGTADAGARSFINLSKDIRNSDIGKNLRALGYSIDDINGSTANYLKITGGRTAEEMKNTKALTASAGAYMQQLDMLSAITGQSREQQEKALQEATQNAAYESYLQTLDEEGRKKATTAMQNALAVGGKGAADALKSQLMGLPPMTEAAQNFTALLPNAAKGVSDMGNAVSDSSKSLKDVNRSYSQAMVGSAQDAKNLGKEQVAAMSMSGGAMADTAMQAQRNANLLQSKQIKNADDFDALQAQIAKDQKAREQSTAAQAAETEQAFKNLGAELMAALMPVIKELTPVIQNLAQEMMQFAKDNMPAIKAGLQMVVQFVKDMFSPEGREKVAKQLGEGLGRLLSDAWKNFRLFGSAENDAKREELDRNHASQSSLNAGGMDFSAGSFDGGGIAEGPQSGYPALLHGPEAVVPLPDGRKIPVSLDMKLPDFKSLIPQNLQAMISDIQKSPPKNVNDALSKFSSMAETFLAPKSEKTAQADNIPKDFISELQTLNKQTAQMISHLREAAETSRRSLDAIKGLNGNLLA
jgi:molecular chaperone GrpE (heat shock protein)